MNKQSRIHNFPIRGTWFSKLLRSCLGFGLVACNSQSATAPNDGGMLADFAASCVTFAQPAQRKPLNLYIMHDKSSSMTGAKWTLAQTGLVAFAEDAKSSGVQAALRFFPRAVDTTPACDAVGYKEPLIPYTPLPDGTASFSAAFNAETPDGTNTPTYPALGGAYLKAIEIASNSPNAANAVLLVTDGQPQGPAAMCNGKDPSAAQVVADLAAAAFSLQPPISTYVIGLPGVDASSANLIAAAGGSQAAILVANGNIGLDFENALYQVAQRARPCAYELPSQVISGAVSQSLVNLRLKSGNGASTLLPFDSACRGPGWHFNDDKTPTAILPCDNTCAALSAMPDAFLQVELGCMTITN